MYTNIYFLLLIFLETRNCTAMEFKCSEGNKCIPQSAVCDGRYDCKDHSDELTDDCQSGKLYHLSKH